MNDVFDDLNGRVSSQAITKENWERKKSVLDEMLGVLDRTEEAHKQILKDKKKKESNLDGLPANMFCSDTTLKAFRTDISNTLSLVDEMFKEGFQLILSGRWNQDSVEVF